MTIDRDKALGAPPTVQKISWTARDVLLYHLSLGAGADAAAGPELALTYERGLTVLPTFAMVAGTGISSGTAPAPSFALPGIEIDLRRILHAGQGLKVHRPLPAAGTATLSSRVSEVWDKGKAAVIVRESTATGPDGDPLWTSRMQIWARGAGGFGGEPGPRTGWTAPDRAPDAVLDAPTTTQQALLYRLNGDLNPLHVDPEFAKAAGFDRPVLHGLASYGLMAKALVGGVLDGDASRLTELSVRFGGVLFPGESVRTAVWRDGDRLLLHATCPERDDAPVLVHGTARITP
ncbi:MaoC/PaaZ C-terminal domain-containing protein [Streptomyces sp. BBFR102]|uniref:MaoC family dehydratase n=1 Tax=Streptomyces sp. BBFR102 TaxID=3448171 RepID=UPI003F529752